MKHSIALAAAALVLAAPAAAQDVRDRPPLLEALLACRSLAGEAERLACFDRAAAAFETAERSGDVAVVDRAQARAARRSLFGLDIESVNLFGGLNEDRIDTIETRLTSARQGPRGAWTFVLADGSTWLQIDDERLGVRMSEGTPVRIRQGALGSYLLSVNGAPSVRARRQR